MTDITPDFSICLKEKGAQPIVRREYDLEQIDAFLQDAYSIVRHTSMRVRAETHNIDRMLGWCHSLRSFDPSDPATFPPPRRSVDDKPTDKTELDH